MKRHRSRVLFIILVALLAAVRLNAQSRADCLICHSDHSLSKEKDAKQISLFVNEASLNGSAHKKLVCISCHIGFSPDKMPHKDNITPVNCLQCHQGVQLKHQFHPQLAEAIAEHREPDVSCKDCHGTHDVVSPKIDSSKFAVKNLVVACGECHGDVVEHFNASAHGKALSAGVAGAPNCLTCHRNTVTGVDTTAAGRLVKIAQVKLCLSCHLDNPDVKARVTPNAGFIAEYEKSVHGAAVMNGNSRAANCVDCHGSHDMNKGADQNAMVNRKNIPETCGKCHESIAVEFNGSIHGKALASGVMEAPTCTNCHGEHNILNHNDPNSPVATANLSRKVCSGCHESVKLSEKFGVAGNRGETFSDSYHGLALRGGSLNVANCASCHGAHNIKPSNDPASTVNKANLAVTCGKCHPGANAKFAVGSVHVAFTAKEDPALYWISSIYVWMIVVVIGGMFAHNFLDFLKKSRRRLLIRRGHIVEEHAGHRLYLRMNRRERLQHAALLVSFLTLVITGFMLRYPDSWWVIGLRSFIPMLFELRSWVHRVAGVVMVLAGVYHLYYVFFTAEGRGLIRDLAPKISDLTDAVAVLKYNLGISPDKPQFGRFSYIEKSEYWALVWGTIVMAVTGMVMWFDNTFLGMITKLGYDISRTVHFYEAWLATLAILVWHFYYVLFNPDTYPMNLTWLKGTITEQEMLEEHPLELARLKAGEKSDEILVVEEGALNANGVAPNGNQETSVEKTTPKE